MIKACHALLAFILGCSTPVLGGLSAANLEIADRLLATPERDAFLKGCGRAAAQGMPAQTILEIRFLHLVEHGDRAQLAELSKDLETFQEPFQVDNSLIFAVPEDFQAILEYTKALVSLEADDDAAFKKHITEAFWLSPKQSQLFGQHIEQRRLNKYLKELVVDLSRPIPDQLARGENIAMAELAKDRPAILLNFWSPWSNSVEEDLPTVRDHAHKLKEFGIPMVSVLMDGNDQHRLEADLFVTTKAFDLPSRWLLDHTKNSLTDLLRISEVPAFILLTPAGKVLYHGKMDDPRFLATLANVLKPPNATAIIPESLPESTRPEEPTEPETISEPSDSISESNTNLSVDAP